MITAGSNGRSTQSTNKPVAAANTTNSFVICIYLSSAERRRAAKWLMKAETLEFVGNIWIQFYC